MSYLNVCFSEKLNKIFSAHYEFADRREMVTSARTYFYQDEHVCDANVAIFIDGINTVSGSLYYHRHRRHHLFAHNCIYKYVWMALFCSMLESQTLNVG